MHCFKMNSTENSWIPPWTTMLVLLLALNVAAALGTSAGDKSVADKESSKHSYPVTASHPASKKTDPKYDENGRLIIVDGGTTDEMGIAEFFIYFGAISLALVCFTALIGIILGILDQIQATPTATGGYGAPTDTYSSYKRVYDVSSAIDNGYSMYDTQPLDSNMMMSMN